MKHHLARKTELRLIAGLLGLAIVLTAGTCAIAGNYRDNPASYSASPGGGMSPGNGGLAAQTQRENNSFVSSVIGFFSGWFSRSNPTLAGASPRGAVGGGMDPNSRGSGVTAW